MKQSYKSTLPFVKLFLLTLLLSLLFTPLIGQSKKSTPIISGTVIDGRSQHPIGEASVWLYREGVRAKALKYEYTKLDGSFKIAAPDKGRFKLIFRTYGYLSDSILVEVTDTTKDVGAIKLKRGEDITDVQTIGNVVVTATRPLIEQQSDRFIYDVSRDPDAKRMRMTGILEKIPTMNFSTGKLEFSGSMVAQLLINGEKNEFINVATQFPMNHIRGSIMEKIEVIPPGSPEYNNEHIIVNIITARPLPNGFAAEVEGSGKSDNAWSTDVNFVSKVRDKFVFRIGYSSFCQESPKLVDSTLQEFYNNDALFSFREGITQSWNSTNRQRLQFRSSTILWKYKLDMGLSTLWGSRGLHNESQYSGESNGVESPLESYFSLNSSKTIPSLNGDLRLTLKKTRDRTLYLAYNYADNRTEFTNSTDLEIEGHEKFTSLFSEGENYSKVHTFQSFDLKRFNLKHSLTTRALYTHRTYDDLTNYHYNSLESGSHEELSGLNYKQQVAGISARYNYRVRKFSASATLGGEYESNKGIFYATNTPLSFDHWQFTPMVNLSYKPATKYTIYTRYTMRSRRPSINMLNPYEDNSNPYNIVRGNPELNPETIHYISGSLSRSLGFSVAKTSLGISLTLIPNAIERITELAESDLVVTTYKNVGNRKMYTISSDNIIPIIPKAGVFLATVVSYHIISFNSANPDIGENLTSGFSCIASTSFRLWKSTNVKLNYLLSSTHNIAQSTKTDYLHRYNIRVDQPIIKNRLSGAITLYNPFESRSRLKEDIAGHNFRLTTNREYIGRVIEFSLRLNFGRLKDRVAEAEQLPEDAIR